MVENPEISEDSPAEPEQQLARQRALRESIQVSIEGRPSVRALARGDEEDPLLEMLRVAHPELDPQRK